MVNTGIIALRSACRHKNALSAQAFGPSCTDIVFGERFNQSAAHHAGKN